MFDTGDLQAFIEKIQGGTIAVDLLKIGQAHYAQYANSGNLCNLLIARTHTRSTLQGKSNENVLPNQQNVTI